MLRLARAAVHPGLSDVRVNRPKPIGDVINIYQERDTGIFYEVSKEGWCWRKQRAVGSDEWTDWEWLEDAPESLRGKPS